MPRSAYADGYQRSQSPILLKNRDSMRLRHSLTSHVHETAFAPRKTLHYGKTSDPAKTTYSRMDLIERPCSSCGKDANTRHERTRTSAMTRLVSNQ